MQTRDEAEFLKLNRFLMGKMGPNGSKNVGFLLEWSIFYPPLEGRVSLNKLEPRALGERK